MFIASAVAVAATGVKKEESEPPPASEVTVGGPLASGSPDEPENVTPQDDTNSNKGSEANDNVPPVSTPPPHPQSELIKQAKQVLIPIIIQNVRLRDPDANEETIQKRVESLITEKQCLEFVNLAKEFRQQMHARGSRSPSRTLVEGGGQCSRSTTQDRSGTQTPLVLGQPLPLVPGNVSMAGGSETHEECVMAGNFENQSTTEEQHMLSSGVRLRSEPVASTSTMPTADIDSAAIPSNVALAQTSTGRSPPRAPRAMRIGIEKRPRSFNGPYPPPSLVPSRARRAATDLSPAHASHTAGGTVFSPSELEDLSKLAALMRASVNERAVGSETQHAVASAATVHFRNSLLLTHTH